VPPVFIVVCNNTATSKLVYEWISGWQRDVEGQPQTIHYGHLRLFSNFDQQGNPLPRMNTLLIDSRQIEAGDALDPGFRKAAEPEIEQFRHEKAAREGAGSSEAVTDSEILREVMNTVGKEGRLGEQIRCVVSVAMHLSKRLVERYFRDGDAIPPYHLVGKLQPITRRWLSDCVKLTHEMKLGMLTKAGALRRGRATLSAGHRDR
jgi:hypothetical protein